MSTMMVTFLMFFSGVLLTGEDTTLLSLIKVSFILSMGTTNSISSVYPRLSK